MSEPESPSARPYMAKSLPRPSPYHWKADEHMRVNDCGEHWCIWAVDADGKLAHTEPVATVWNYLHPGRQHADLIEQAPNLLAENDRLKARNAELVPLGKPPFRFCRLSTKDLVTLLARATKELASRYSDPLRNSEGP